MLSKYSEFSQREILGDFIFALLVFGGEVGRSKATISLMSPPDYCHSPPLFLFPWINK